MLSDDPLFVAIDFALDHGRISKEEYNEIAALKAELEDAYDELHQVRMNWNAAIRAAREGAR